MKHPTRQDVRELVSSIQVCTDTLRGKIAAVPPGTSPPIDNMRRWLEGISLFDPLDHHAEGYDPRVVVYLEQQGRKRRAPATATATESLNPRGNGARARAAKQSPERRREIALKAAAARWGRPYVAPPPSAPAVNPFAPPAPPPKLPKSGKVPFRFHDPADPNNEAKRWTGFGRTPEWVKELKEKGATFASLLIPGAPPTWPRAAGVDSDSADAIRLRQQERARQRQALPYVARFRNPNNERQVWNGAGIKPTWVRELLDQGHTLESLLIPGMKIEKLRRRRKQPDGTWSYAPVKQPREKREPTARLVRAGDVAPNIAKQAPVKLVTLEQAKAEALKILSTPRFKPEAPVTRDYTGPKVLVVSKITAGQQPPVFSCPWKPSLRWNGKGEKPSWLRQALDMGHTLAKMNIGGPFNEADYADKPKTLAKGRGGDALREGLAALKAQAALRDMMAAQRTAQPAEVIYRYQSPFNNDKWTGEGTPPRWFKLAIKNYGFVPSDLLIPGVAPIKRADLDALIPRPPELEKPEAWRKADQEWSQTFGGK